MNVCKYICVQREGTQEPRLPVGPPTQMSGSTGALGKGRVFANVCLYMFMCAQGRQRMCDLGKEGGVWGETESASFGIFRLFSILPLPPLAFCFLMTPSATLIASILSTHTPCCLSLSDSSSQGPGACRRMLHRSTPNSGGGWKCTHIKKNKRAASSPPSIDGSGCTVGRLGLSVLICHDVFSDNPWKAWSKYACKH